MNWIAFLEAVAVCMLSALLEAVSASRSGMDWFKRLAQPKYSLPFSAWYLVGGFYYIMAGLIAYRLFDNSADPHFFLAISVLISMLLVNGLTNFLLFKRRSLMAFNISIYLFSLIVIALFVELLQFDTVSANVLFLYLLWLIYDIYYFHSLRKLNKI
jgi:tryptophan-rich sensory protein